MWRDPNEAQAHRDISQELLADHGVWRAGRPGEEFLRTMTVLGRAAQEFSAGVEPSTGRYHLHVATSGNDAMLACHVPSSGNVVLRPARFDALVGDLEVELRDVQPGPGPALSVPESDLRQALGGSPARRDVRRGWALSGCPGSVAARSTQGWRDGVGGYRTSGGLLLHVLRHRPRPDLFSFTEEPGYDRVRQRRTRSCRHGDQQNLRPPEAAALTTPGRADSTGGRCSVPTDVTNNPSSTRSVSIVDDNRWGFEEAEDWECDQSPIQAEETAPDSERLTGQDPDRIVSVTVSPAAEVLSVALDRNWTRAVDPRGLHSSVLAAANAATIAALARQVEDVQRNVPAPPAFGGRQEDQADESPLGPDDMLRLVDAATTEMARFIEQAATVVDRRITVESVGGHLTGSGINGQVVEISIDPTWAGSVRYTEIESEITDVLRQLHAANTPPEIVNGPQGPAIAEIMGMLYDPQRLSRRVGLALPLNGENDRE
ncbi:ESX secretion-associated protein EspG [Amycolatopsis carbonis]|uniref:ESX secretion-associated protein EspG n=1 Tax=Amycolatopsis carbonis TaxID=715471 RepID=A0A9Y2IF63_9PSEU|nr:ESX secretion-associated protein EspG [Amycolatopsis sp. 2-15]WIX78151.1 ESX secretion-associated protein EspG [Amycolatopsis sp. 2-15]